MPRFIKSTPAGASSTLLAKVFPFPLQNEIKETERDPVEEYEHTMNYFISLWLTCFPKS